MRKSLVAFVVGLLLAALFVVAQDLAVEEVGVSKYLEIDWAEDYELFPSIGISMDGWEWQFTGCEPSECWEQFDTDESPFVNQLLHRLWNVQQQHRDCTWYVNGVRHWFDDEVECWEVEGGGQECEQLPEEE